MVKEILGLLNKRSDFFLNLLLQHLEISLTAIGFAIVIGLVIGILISEYEKTSKLTLGVINFVYTIPSISLLGFLIPFSGIGNTTAIIALTIYALLPMVRNTYTGFSQVNNTIIEAAEGMGSTRFQMLYKIKFPLALPVIMSGIRNMVTMTIALTGIASFIGAGGLGVAIYRGITTNNSTMTIAGSLLIAILAVVIDLFLGVIERLLKDQRKLKGRHGFFILSLITLGTIGILGRSYFIGALWLIVVGIIIDLFLKLIEKFVLNKSKFQRKRKVLLAGFGVVIGVAFLGNESASSAPDNIIRVATKPMTEQLIIGEMLQIFIQQETDLQVELTSGVGGGTSNILPALLNGEFDLYPEYTGTGWNLVLGKDGFYEESLFDVMEEKFQSELGLTWATMLGFNNTFGLAVRREIAEQYHLVTFSDLVAVSDQLVFGAEPDFFEREDGYPLLVDKHGFNFKGRVDLDIGLKYQAIDEGQIDVMNIFTTDGQLSVANVVVLEDDLQIYPSYKCGIVVRMEILEQHPELKAVLAQLENIFTDQSISKLNYLVEVGGQDPRTVAENFLEEMNLLR